MLNIFIFIQVVLAILLVTIILLQRTGVDSLSGLGGNNLNLISAKTVNSFLVKTTAILAALFMLNSLILTKVAINSHQAKMTPVSIQAAPLAE